MTVIFSAGFNAGTFAEWTGTSGKVTVTAGAALAGSAYGCNVQVDDLTADYCNKTGLSIASGKTATRFYLNPNSLSYASNHDIYILLGYNASSVTQQIAFINWYSPNYGLIVGIKNNSSSWVYASTVNITNAEHCLEFMQQRASSAPATDGYCDWWIDGNIQTRIANVANYTSFDGLSRIIFGGLGNMVTGDSGNFYLDELVITDGSYIGPVSTGLKFRRSLQERIGSREVGYATYQAKLNRAIAHIFNDRQHRPYHRQNGIITHGHDLQGRWIIW